MRMTLVMCFAMSLFSWEVVRAQETYEAAPKAFFDYLETLQRQEPLKGATVEADSVLANGFTYRFHGEIKLLELPPQFRDYHIAAVGADEAAYLTVETSSGLPLAPIFFPYWGPGGKRAPSRIQSPESILEGDKAVGFKFPKALPGPGWFVWAWKSGGRLPSNDAPPAAVLNAVYAVENPLKAPTLKEELIVIGGTKIKAEAPAKFMTLTDELKGFWVAPVAGGKSGAVLVDSERWKVGFLPFENGKSKGNAVQPLKGEPIVVNGATVGWRFTKPSPAAGWFLSIGLLPEKNAEPAPEAKAP